MESYARRVESSEKAEDVLMRVLGTSGWVWEETYPQIGVPVKLKRLVMKG